jgi:hypothetical protein
MDLFGKKAISFLDLPMAHNSLISFDYTFGNLILFNLSMNYLEEIPIGLSKYGEDVKTVDARLNLINSIKNVTFVKTFKLTKLYL